MVADLTRDGKRVSAKIDSLTELGARQSRPMLQGDVVIAVSGAPGLPAILNHDACIHDGFVGLRNLNTTRLDPDFLYAYLSFVRVTTNSQAVGAIFKNLTTDQIKALKIPDIALTEQKRIAEILDRAEAVRSKRRAALAQLDTLSQSVFVDLAGDLVTNSKKWQEVTFEELCERVTVGIVVKPASYYVENGVPALRSLNVKAGKIVMKDLVYFSQRDNDTALAKSRLRTGDIVLVRSGQPGTAAVVPPELDGINAIDLLIATPITAKCEPAFLCHFFNSPSGRALALSSQRGQVQKHLNVGSLTKTPIPLPPLSIQREFARRADAVEKLKAKHRQSLQEFDSLFASLQSRAFKGQL